jgi:hypothetical protein
MTQKINSNYQIDNNDKSSADVDFADHESVQAALDADGNLIGTFSGQVAYANGIHGIPLDSTYSAPANPADAGSLSLGDYGAESAALTTVANKGLVDGYISHAKQDMLRLSIKMDTDRDAQMTDMETFWGAKQLEIMEKESQFKTGLFWHEPCVDGAALVALDLDPGSVLIVESIDCLVMRVGSAKLEEAGSSFSSADLERLEAIDTSGREFEDFKAAVMAGMTSASDYAIFLPEGGQATMRADLGRSFRSDLNAISILDATYGPIGDHSALTSGISPFATIDALDAGFESTPLGDIPRDLGKLSKQARKLAANALEVNKGAAWFSAQRMGNFALDQVHAFESLLEDVAADEFVRADMLVSELAAGVYTSSALFADMKELKCYLNGVLMAPNAAGAVAGESAGELYSAADAGDGSIAITFGSLDADDKISIFFRRVSTAAQIATAKARAEIDSQGNEVALATPSVM